MRLKREMAGVVKTHFRIWIVPLEGFGTGRQEEGIAVAPDGERWWLLAAKVFQELVISLFVFGPL